METIFIDKNENEIDRIDFELYLSNGDIYEVNGNEFEVQYRVYNKDKNEYYIVVA